ncbi:MAG: TolB-like 6-bladed beta-propeller domain-containing protein, partial [Tannerella sp.]|jgi:hypothetical protein|nr:TolB-like 6-bladed beta-propeller domain-containing protein [Tannerella sp.]
MGFGSGRFCEMKINDQKFRHDYFHALIKREATGDCNAFAKKTVVCHSILFLFPLFLFAIACSNKQEVIYQAPVFEKQQEVSFEIINDSFLFKGSSALFVCDSLLILCASGINPIIHLFNKETGLFLKSVGVTGQGPNELVLPLFFSFDYNSSIIYVFDAGKRAMVSYDINNVMNDKDIPLKEKRIKNAAISNMVYLRDSSFAAYVNLKGLTVSALDENSSENTFISEAPLDIASNKWWEYFVASNTAKAVSPDGSKYVMATYYGGIMDIYSIKSDEISLSHRKHFYKLVCNTERMGYSINEETLFGFRNLAPTNNFIYATAFGIKIPTETPKNIWKFDWDGNPIENYICDYNIEDFAIDEPSEMIYAVVYNKDGEFAIAKGSCKQKR